MGYVLADQIAERVLGLKHAEKAALVQLARYADNDGRNVWPGDRLLALALESSDRHAERMLARLTALGWVLDDGWRGHVKRRRIAVERLEDCQFALDVMKGRTTDSVSVVGRIPF